MAITDPSGNIEAFLTDLARQYIARAVNGELVYKLESFYCGRGGYNPTDPFSGVLPVNTADVALADQVYPTASTYASYESIEQPTMTSLVVNCRLPSTPSPSNADYGLGEIGVWARILTSNVPSEIGQLFLYALAHFPARGKTFRDVFLLRPTIQL